MARFDRHSLKKGVRRLRFYAGGWISYHLPDALYRMCLSVRFATLSAEKRRRALERVDHYVRLPEDCKVDASTSVAVGDFRYPKSGKHRYVTYFLDLYRSVRLFPKQLRFSYLFGDVSHALTAPTFVKTRPIMPDGQTCGSVLCPLNRVRHLVFVDDRQPWSAKIDRMVFRNYVIDQPHRVLFLQRTIDSPLCDCGQVNSDATDPRFVKPYMPMRDMLRYKFIACIEGNDVATNLKWVMSSNSIAVMPRPRIESWFMEGSLIPGYHYIEVKDDFSDVDAQLRYYLDHPDEALAIIRHANEYARGFASPALEHWVENRVVERYFKLTGQL